MSGHSKWANIKHKKERTDAKRGKIFTRLIREITVATKIGGGDALANARLRLAMDKALDANIPKDTVRRAIDRGMGKLAGADYVALRYEGYGPSGAAIMVDCLTDNKTRTAADVRHVFNKLGGNMGTHGCVAFQFVEQGYLLFAPDTDQNMLMEVAIDAGAEDVIVQEDGSLEVISRPENFIMLRSTLGEKGFLAADSDVTLCPINPMVLSKEDRAKIQQLMDALEDLDDVQAVYTTAL